MITWNKGSNDTNEAIDYPIFEVLRECRRAAGLDGPKLERRTANIIAAFRCERRKPTTRQSGDYGAQPKTPVAGDARAPLDASVLSNVSE